eukprot:TRINITY_DN62965_c0_g1_i1.p2 TRINITY_DN62965_c0_g1~~TRINITY_DN62965_c0_g1_i1.p2  ORF type:complete len:242 (+),score=49.73 TRINITY_DN62965_c0_g1_i1:1179-1904(+)
MDLSFQFCNHLPNESIIELGSGLSRLRNLEELHLCLDCCSRVTSLEGLGIGFNSLSKLRKLKLNISRLNIDAIDELGSGLAGLVSLEDFWMQSSFNKSIRDICNFGNSLAYMPQLQQLHLNFSDCNAITSIEHLGRSLQKLANLKRLTLYLKGLVALESVRELSLALPALTDLTHFSLELNDCQLLDAAEILKLVRSSLNLKLETWSLALFGCKQLGKDLVYFFGLSERERLLELLEARGK